MKELISLAKQILHQPEQSQDLLHSIVQRHQFPIVNEQRATFTRSNALAPACRDF